MKTKLTSKMPGLLVALGGRPEPTAEPRPGIGGDNSGAAPSSTDNLDSVPVSALGMPDDQEQMQSPEVGDEVNYQVTGKVVSIEGDVARVQRTSINGQDLPEPAKDNEPANHNNDNGGDGERESLGGQAAGMGTMIAIMLLLLLSFVPGARAQSTTVVGSAYQTNWLLVATVPTKLYALTGYNASAATEYVQVFQTNSLPVNGMVPIFSVPVAAGQYYSLDFSYYGADLDSVAVASSGTAATLTMTAAQTSFQAITKSR